MAKIHQALWFRFLLLTILSSMAWAQFPVTDDAYVSSAQPTTNNGNSPSLVVQQSSSGTTLIKLDLSQLTNAGVTSTAVSKAYLKLYTSAITGQGTFDLYRVTSSWQEATVTYNTVPTMALVTAGGTCPSGIQCVNTASKYVQVDITTLLQGWLSGSFTNYGLALKPNTTTISVTFESKESTTTSHAPELDVVLNTSLAQLQGQITPAQVTPGTYNISITGNAATATSATTAGSATTASSAGVAGALALTPSQCPTTPTQQFATGIQANGNANCSTISSAHLPSSLVYNNQNNNFLAGFKQTFTANGTYAGLNIAGISVNNPTGLAAGDVWFRLDLKHLHFYDGSTTHQLMFRDDTLPESQVTNLTTDLATQTTNLNNEIANRQAAVTAEATARATTDATLQSNINAETTRAQGAEATLTTNLTNEITRATNAENTKADLVKPVQANNSALMGGSCTTATANAMVLNPTAPVGQQLLICQMVGNNLQWVLVNDEQALTQQLTQADQTITTNLNNEISRAEAAESTLQTNINNEASTRQAADTAEANARIAADNAEAVTRAAADTALGNAISTETTRAQGAEATLTTNLSNEITRATNAEATKADLVKPVQVNNSALMGGSCTTTVANAMVLNPTAPVGQQLLICQAVNNQLQWVLVNDEQALTQQLTQADTTLQNNINAETAARIAADSAEALARAAGDAATLTSANNYTDSTKTNILTQPQTFSGNETLSGNNSFTGSNTFSGAKVDLSGAGATLPVQTTTAAVPASGSPNACVDGEMLMKVNGNPGHQLFICNAAHDGWVMVNDDTATASAANAYTDQQVTAERNRAESAESTITNNLNSEISRAESAESAEAATRAAADAALSTAIASESSRAQGAEASLSSSITAETERATAAEATKSSLAGDNTFTGKNVFTGNTVDLSHATATLPVQTTIGTVPTSGSPNACVDGQMLMKVNGDPGQQLFICNAAHDGWVMVNDDTATASAANAYTDSKVAAEAAARVAGDASTLSSANTFTSNAVAAEATLRATGDAAALTSANTYTDSTKTNILTQPQTFSGNETLNGNNSFTGSNTFSGAKVDLSGAGATLPVQTTTAAVSASGSPNACVDGEMLMKVNGAPGQQLFICNAAHDGWVMVNDDTATASAANAYTDSKVAAEAAARIAGDTATLSSANGFTTTAVANEAAARVAGDAATLASANAYTDTGLALKANLAVGNNFTGDQSIAGNATVKGTLSLPALSTTANTPSASQRLNLQGWDGSNATVFQWLVNDSGKLDLFSGVNGQSPSTSGLMIGPDGKITFASGQTFPGTQNTLTAGTGISIASNTISNTATTTVDGTTIHNSGSALNPVLSVGAITESQVTNLSSDLLALSASIATKATAASITGATSTKITYNSQGIVTAGAQAQFSDIGGTATSSQLPTDVAYNDAANAFSQTQALAPKGATSQPSNALQLNATDGSSASQSAQLQAKTDGSLSFQFGPTAGPITDKLSIAPTGVITFAPGQTFPGTNNGTVTSVNTGAGLTGGPITTTGTISIANGGVTNAMLQNSSIGVVAGTGIGLTGTSNLGGSFTIANTGVLSFNGRNGLVSPQANDYSFAQLSGTDSATSNLVYSNQANTYTAGSKQTFKASATLAGLSFDGGVTNDPTTVASGDTWFNSTANHLKFFDGTTTKTLAFTTDIAAGTVTGTGLTSGQLIVGAGGSSIATGNLTGDVTTSGSTATTLAATIAGAHTFSNASNSFTGSGAGLTNVNAASLGGLASSAFAQLGTNDVFTGSVTASSFSGNGANLTALSATNISTGTLADARLSTNVPLLNAANSFTNTTGNTFAGTTTLGNTAAASGGLLIPPSASGAQKVSFPFDMEATNTGGTLHLFRILAQDGTTPNWAFQFCNSAPCTPANNGLSIAGLTGIITFASGQTFPGTGSGTVTQVNTGSGLTGGPITTTGTIALANTAVTPGSYTAANITVDAQGRLTAASSNVLTNGTVTSVATGAGLTGGPVTTSGTIDMATAQKTRTICYVAGADNNTSALDTTFSQKSFFANMIGPMTAVATGLRCQTDAGTATIQINKNGGAAGTLSNTLACTTTWGANSGSFAVSSIALNDVLDFSITATSGAKRVTACLSATVN